MFGIDYPWPIEGPKVCGRYITAKKELKRYGTMVTLPTVFYEGGEHRELRPEHRLRLPAIGGGGGERGNPTPLNEPNECAHAVAGLVLKHEGEYRRWCPKWGRPTSPESQDWHVIHEPAVGGRVGANEFLLKHHQLQVGAVTSSSGSDLQSARQAAQQMAMSGSGSTIVRPKAGQPLAVAFEARNVFIVNLPELFLKHLNTRTAAELYEEWLTCEVIIGRRPPRGHNRAR